MPYIVRASIRIRNMHASAADFGPFDAEHDTYQTLASLAGRIDCFGARILALTDEPVKDEPLPTPLHRVE